MLARSGGGTPITALRARAYTVPTDGPEGDGTIGWSSSTLVLVEAEAGGETGIGFTYGAAAAASVVDGTLAAVACRYDAMDVGAVTRALWAAVRNMGRGGIAATAISATDLALWDLKAKMLGLPLATLLGSLRETVPIYGSGGFTTAADEQLCNQFDGWVHEDGCRFVKMKIGADPGRDRHRMEVARRAIGDATLFIDANGAFSPREALAVASKAADLGVAWFEEPVSGDDLDGLRFVRERAPVGMDIAAGEYNYDPDSFRHMLIGGAVDVQQADATRCGGITGFLAAAALCDAFHTPLSGHCAPAMHLHAACAAPRLRHLEWFADHVRIERTLFEGAPIPRDGHIQPDLSRPGHGLSFKNRDAERYAV